jgi:3-hydroxymyristoyl/3-hydroxydecanoyl-(acyl carrier protein) dehydratase
MKKLYQNSTEAVPICWRNKGNQWKRMEGHFTRWKLRFYKGHFEHHPVTPVILTETAQIGLVCLGIFILDNNFTKTLQ